MYLPRMIILYLKNPEIVSLIIVHTHINIFFMQNGFYIWENKNMHKTYSPDYLVYMDWFRRMFSIWKKKKNNSEKIF